MGNSNEFSKVDSFSEKTTMNHNAETLKYGEFDQLFNKFDDNNTNSISEEEFKNILDHYLTIHPEHTEKIMELKDQIQIDELNPLNRDEFRLLMYNYLCNTNNDEKLLEVFKIFDKNMNTEITVVEIIHIFTKLGLNLTKSDVELMLLEADDSGDGTLDFEEFIKIMIEK